MFTFHKPRVYRSTEGCCICRAKSSSSRFTDSKKYENDCMKCFNLKQPRYGEICNACVLLVKRYKRLPAGSNRHWGHVVDARAGPGTKSLTKHKKHNSEESGEQSASKRRSSSSQNGGKTSIGEKFSKIFKKNKGKLKSNISCATTATPTNVGNIDEERKTLAAAAAAASMSCDAATYVASCSNEHQQQSLLGRSVSFGSDGDCGDDNNIAAAATTSASAVTAVEVVDFQTQKRSSPILNIVVACQRRRRRSVGSSNDIYGSKRRKCMPPRKLDCGAAASSVPFFDANEWQQRQSCCGLVYECAALAGALIIDAEQYKPCVEHQKKYSNVGAGALQTEHLSHHQQEQQTQNIILSKIMTTTMATTALPRAIITATTIAAPIIPPPMKQQTTQVLKKHHLFFKRQSECFPHSDPNVISATNSQLLTATTQSLSSSSSLSSSATTATAITTPILKTDLLLMAKTGAIAASTTTTTTAAAATTTIIPTRHFINTNKLTTLSATNSITINNHLANVSSSATTNVLMQKLKATETARIGKQSLEKLSTAPLRLIPNDLNDVRHIIKTVDKSYILNNSRVKKQTATTMPLSSNQQQQQHPNLHQHISIVGSIQQLNSVASGLSPTLSASSTTSASSSSSSSSTPSSSLAPKFSDNSSDSGFDENLQDRKSASPLQEDTEKKMLTRPGMPNGKKIFSTAGVNSYCPAQSMPLQPGIEEATKLRQQLKQSAVALSHHRNNRTTNIQLAQIVGDNNSSSGTNMRLRALYNNNSSSNNTSNTNNNNNSSIKHENGITTIVPTSSLTAAATLQATAMSGLLAPNTVTITAAPAHANINASNKHLLGTQSLGGRLCFAPSTTATTTALHLNKNNNNNNLANVNPKVIFVKASSKYNSNVVTPSVSNNNNNNNYRNAPLMAPTATVHTCNNNQQQQS